MSGKPTSPVRRGQGQEVRGRGRPPGTTPQGVAARQRLYQTSIEFINERGYEAATLRDIAAKAGVSVGLLYRYFPSKRAVVLKLYADLTAEYVQRSADMSPGKWRDRFFYVLRASLEVLSPHRRTLIALIPALVGDPHEGLFARGTAFSRLQVQQPFGDAVVNASDAPKPDVGSALGRMLYLLHLAIILWWLLDRSPGQRATVKFVNLLERVLPLTAAALKLPPVRTFIRSFDRLFRDALFEAEPG